MKKIILKSRDGKNTSAGLLSNVGGIIDFYDLDIMESTYDDIVNLDFKIVNGSSLLFYLVNMCENIYTNYFDEKPEQFSIILADDDIYIWRINIEITERSYNYLVINCLDEDEEIKEEE